MTIKQSEGLIYPVLKDKYVRRLIAYVVGAAATLLAIYFLSFLFGPFLRLSHNPGDWGAFGDFIAGILNPFIAALTLILVAATVHYTREMLAATREEMRAAKMEMSLQNFDTKMFFLMRLFREVRDELYSIRGSARGAAAFDAEFHGILAEVKGNTHETTSKMKAKSLIRAFAAKLSELSGFKTYFSSLNSILNLMDLMGHWNDDHAKLTNLYSHLIASFLSEDEVVALFLYSRGDMIDYRGAELLYAFLNADAIPIQSGMVTRALPNLDRALHSED